MRKNNIYFYFAALLLLVGCEDFDDKNFDGLDDMTRPENQINKEYTLTACLLYTSRKETLNLIPYIIF